MNRGTLVYPSLDEDYDASMHASDQVSEQLRSALQDSISQYQLSYYSRLHRLCLSTHRRNLALMTDLNSMLCIIWHRFVRKIANWEYALAKKKNGYGPVSDQRDKWSKILTNGPAIINLKEKDDLRDGLMN